MGSRRRDRFSIDPLVQTDLLNLDRLDPEEFSRLVITFGVECELRRSVPCPCQRPETGQASMGCRICRGFGIAWPKRLRALVPGVYLHSHRNRREAGAAGEKVVRTLEATFPSGFEPSWGDLLIPIEAPPETIREVLTRAELMASGRQLQATRTSDRVFHQPAQARRELLAYSAIEGVASCWWRGGEDGQGLIEGAEGVDFTIHTEAAGPGGDPAVEVKWRPGRGPTPGTSYTLCYLAQPIFILGSPDEPTDKAQGGFPRSISARRLESVLPRLARALDGSRGAL